MNDSKRSIRGAIAIAAFSAAIGLALTANPGHAQDRTLYERLGGRDAIVAVVDDFVGNVAANPKINGFFAQTDIPRLKRLLVEQICAGSGGPCAYSGRDMRSAHRGMGVRDEHFSALVGDLVTTLDKFQVPAKEKNELLGVLGPMKADIVSN